MSRSLPVAIDLGLETDQVALQLAAASVRQFISDPASLSLRVGEMPWLT